MMNDHLIFHDVTKKSLDHPTGHSDVFPPLNLCSFKVKEKLYLIRLVGTKPDHFEKLGISLINADHMSMQKCKPMLEVRLCNISDVTNENLTFFSPSWPDHNMISPEYGEQFVIFRRDRHDFEMLDYVDHKGRMKFKPRDIATFSLNSDTLNRHAKTAENLSPSDPDPFDQYAVKCLSDKLIELCLLYL